MSDTTPYEHDWQKHKWIYESYSNHFEEDIFYIKWDEGGNTIWKCVVCFISLTEILVGTNMISHRFILSFFYHLFQPA